MKTICLNHEDVLRLLPERNPDSHKGNYGKVLLICGSRGYTGAAALAAMGALRSGAGLVYLAVPECIYDIEATKLLEPVVLPLSDCEGKISCHAVNEIRTLMTGKDVVLIGPGLGQGEGVFAAVKTVLEEFSGPVILDADGINILSQHMDILRGRTNPTILTPHAGEFARVCDGIIDNRVEAATKFAAEYGAILLLKGNQTVITDGLTLYLNKTGNPGMAVGGSGDMLAGMIASLIGQGIAPLAATACAAWLHGAAGDVCAEQLGQYGMLPTDMLLALPRLMK